MCSYIVNFYDRRYIEHNWTSNLAVRDVYEDRELNNSFALGAFPFQRRYPIARGPSRR